MSVVDPMEELIETARAYAALIELRVNPGVFHDWRQRGFQRLCTELEFTEQRPAGWLYAAARVLGLHGRKGHQASLALTVLRFIKKYK
jgi:hypothetical protein